MRLRGRCVLKPEDYGSCFVKLNYIGSLIARLLQVQDKKTPGKSMQSLTNVIFLL